MAPVSASSLGALLRQYCRAAGITQAQLAEWAGFVSMLERGVRRPVRGTVAQLASAHEISAARRAALEAAAHLSLAKRSATDIDNHLVRPRLTSGGFLGAKPESARPSVAPSA
jgi:transcriptional regulator with XRE-family HTH domain